MKAKIKTQKTDLKSLAVIASLILISLTVSAQDLWRSAIENGPTNEIALAIFEKHSESYPASTNTKKPTDFSSTEKRYKNESEKTMELEEWMTNESLFKAEEDPTQEKVIRTSTFVFKETKDSKLEFEAWMFNPKYWRVRK